MHRFILLAAFFISVISHGQLLLPTDQLRILDSIATQDVPAKAPGIATAIIQNGKLVYEKYAGYADFADSSLIGKNTRFNIASNGKQFTALAILKLIEQRKLSLDDDIRKYFTTLYPLIKEPITIRHLLTHTSGIRDCYDLWSLQGLTWWEKSFSNTDVLQLLQKQEMLNFKPGTKYLYSNSNYILLALLIEKVSGQSFSAYTNALFRQLKMPSTSFESDHTIIRGPIARSYFNFNTWTTYNWIWNVCGDGNLFTTLEDQIQWEKLIQGKGGSKALRKLIALSQQPVPGSAFSNYGYGLEFGRYKNLDYHFHEGATGAWKATLTRFPSRHTTILTLTNTGKSIPSMQTRQLADVLFELPPDQSFLVTKPAAIGAYVSEEEITGTYLTESDFAFRFEKRENKLFLVRSGRNDVELEREADNIFHQKFDPPFKQEFTRSANGTLQVTAYYINHAPYTLTKQSADFTGFNAESLNGTYINTETGTKSNIIQKEHLNYDIRFVTDDDVSKGILVTPGKMLVNNYVLTFTPGYPLVTQFSLNGDRIKEVLFVRMD